MQSPPFSRFLMLAAIVWCAWVSFGGVTNAYDKAIPVSFDKSKGVDIGITTAYENVPSTGFVPLEIRIANYSGRTVNYELATRPGYYGNYDYGIAFTQKFTVPNKTTKVFSIYVPVPNADDRSYFSPGGFSFRGYAVNNGAGHISYPSNNSGGGKPRTGFMLVSQDISATSWEPTRLSLDSSGQSLYGSSIKPESLPRNWLGFAGVDSVWLAESDWSKMAPESREALKEWLMQGGHLFIASQSIAEFNLADLGIKSAGTGISTYPAWLGTVTLLPWDGKSNLLLPNMQNAAITILLDRNELNMQISEGYKDQGNASFTWPLLLKMPDAAAAGFLVLIFMVIFAVLVGPVNLFVFARDPFRFRLFWTTPLLSLATSLLLGGLILIKDGLGASGQALTLIYLPAGENREVRIQEQCTLGGLLLNRRFKMEQPAFLVMLKLNNNYDNRRVMNVNELKTYSGDWFASRSVSGHLLVRMDPSRARVEVVNKAPFNEKNPPQIISSVETPLEEFFFVDESKQYWKAANVSSGQKTVLTPSSPAAFNEFLSKFTLKAGARIKSVMSDALVKGAENHFYASCAEPNKQLIPTLSSIRWQFASAYIVGEATGVEKFTPEVKVIPVNAPPDVLGKMNEILGSQSSATDTSSPTNNPPPVVSP